MAKVNGYSTRAGADQRVAVIGAGVGGLAAAIDLARAGFDVQLFERAATPGGKLRELAPGGVPMDAGPTVFTLRDVFDSLFADSGDALERHLRLRPAQLLARHAWSAHERLDLFADFERSVDAVGRFAGRADALAFRAFAAHARRIYHTLDTSFMRAARPSPLGLFGRVGIAGLGDLWNIKPFATLWRQLAGYFKDPRLIQLFARYATYCGSSPFAAPATLMLIAHVEQAGVWYVEGGMHELARQLAALASRQGARLRYDAGVKRIALQGGCVSAVELDDGELIPVRAVVCNADNNALAAGLFGTQVRHAAAPTRRSARSLSAMTWNLLARPAGFELAHHTVFFSADYRAEFDALMRRREMPPVPTVYVCAPDRCDAVPPGPPGCAERLFCLINAPANGDIHPFDAMEMQACETRVIQRLASFGLTLSPEPGTLIATSPADFHRSFPATGGALYGPASHGWRASFARPGSSSRIPGLYLAGGSTHPGPGVPMAATSGRLAAAEVARDCVSIVRSRQAATYGGTSMR